MSGPSATITEADGERGETKIGSFVGDYEVLGERARGGAGLILRARDRRLEREVALKLPLGGDSVTIARFAREARLTAQLQHPAIVPVFDEGDLPTGEPFYAMKFVEGVSLRDAIADAPDLDGRLALVPHVITAAHAIAYAHRHRVIHRDLKPTNVIVGELGEVVVIDWGLAKHVGEVDDVAALEAGRVVESDVTVAGAIVGTPAYMPPEQARGDAVDERADVYALGALAYHVIAGRPPFAGDSDTALHALREGAPTPLAELEPGAPSDLAAIVMKAMARDPAARYANAAAFAADLEHFREGRLVDARKYSAAARVARWVRRRRVELAIAAVLLTAVAVLVVSSTRRVLAERATARARVDALVLEQGHAALDRDPTEAVAWLARYPAHAPDWSRAHALAAAAESRGVARHVLHLGSTATFWFSRDVAELGGWRVTGDQEGTVHVSSPDGHIWRYAGHRAPIVTVALSTEHFASVSSDGEVRLWPLPIATGRAIGGHRGVVTHVAVRDQRVVSIDDQRHARLLDLTSGESRELAVLEADAVGVEMLADGIIVIAQSSPRLLVWQSDGSLVTHTLPHPPEELESWGDSRKVALLFDDLRVIDVVDGTVEVYPIEERERGGSNWWVRVAPDGRWFITVGWARAPEIVETSTRARRILSGHANQDVSGMELLRDARVVTGGYDETLRVWDPATARELVRHDLAEDVTPIRGAVDADHVAAIQRDRLWFGGRLGPQFFAEITDATFDPGGTRIAAATNDGAVWLVDTITQRMRVFRGAAPTGAVAFTPDGASIVAGDGAGNVWLFPAETAASADPRALAAWIKALTTARVEPGGRPRTP